MRPRAPARSATSRITAPAPRGPSSLLTLDEPLESRRGRNPGGVPRRRYRPEPVEHLALAQGLVQRQRKGRRLADFWDTFEKAAPAEKPAPASSQNRNDVDLVCDYCGFVDEDVLLGVCADCVAPPTHDH